MCNQTVGLVAAALERRGIATVTIQLLKDVAERVRAPRSLIVPFRHGYPLGQPDDPALQQRVIRSALALIDDRETKAPVLREFDPETSA